MLIWLPSHEEDVFLEAAWPGHPASCADCDSQTPGHLRGFFEITILWDQEEGVREPSPIPSGRYTARHVERPADPCEEPVFHSVVFGLGLAEALLACERHSEETGA